MALAKSVVPIAFQGGLDQKSPKELVLPGKFLALENCVRRKLSGVEKRYGYAAFSQAIFGTSDLVSNGNHLDVTQDEVITFANGHCYSYSDANDRNVDKGTALSALVESIPVVRNSGTQAMADMAHQANITVTVWEDSRGGVGYSVYDDTSDSALVYDVQLNATAGRPKVIAFDDVFIIAYYNAGSIITRKISITSPATITTEYTFSGSASDNPFDLDVYDRYGIIAYNNASAGFTLAYVTKDGLPGAAGTNGLPSPVSSSGAGTAASCLTIVGDTANGKIWCSYHGSAGILRIRAYTFDFIAFDEEDVITAAGIVNVTGVIDPASGEFEGAFETSNATVHYTTVSVFAAAFVGNVMSITTAAALQARHVGLGAKAFLVDGVPYYIQTHESTFQPTYYLVRGTDGYIAARIHSNIGGGLTRDTAGTAKSSLPRITLDTAGDYVTALQIRTKLNLESGSTTLTANKGVQKVALTFDDITFKGATLGRNYHLAGGALLNYDGAAVTEHGFHVFPEDLTVAATAGGALAAGTYNFRVIYEWTDAKGQLHRSAPSITVTQVATLNQKVTVTVPTLQITNKSKTTVKVVLYAAAMGLSSVYYRAAETTNTTSNSVAIEYTTESGLTAREILYTTGGVMENIIPPAARVVHAHKNRLFLGGTETDEIIFSKPHVRDEGVGFVDLVKVPIEATGGRVTALATLDDKLIIFKRDRIYLLLGDGPLDTAAQNDYGDPQLIAGDVGTATPSSVVLTPQGLMFKSDKGIYLLSRALGLQYVGSGVEDYNALEITSATVMADENEVRFTTRTGPALVYNYLFGEWSTFSNYEAVAAVFGLNTYLHLKADGQVNREVVDMYADNGTRYAMGIETSWLSFAGVQGFQRIYKLHVLGQFISHAYTRIKIAYDFENAYNETKYFNTQDGLGVGEEYGAESPYGDSGGVYGSTNSEVYQFRIQPARQKCQAIKFRFEDVDTIGLEPGGSFRLIGMTAEVGRKQGAYKLPARKSV